MKNKNNTQRNFVNKLLQILGCLNMTVSRKTTQAFVSLLLMFQALMVVASDLPGASQTSYGVTPAGAFQFQIPILSPKGINNVQPSVGLSFSSKSGNGSLGLGWGISGLGEITRCDQTIARDGVTRRVQHDGDDRYCLNGNPLILTSGSYGQSGSEYRTEIDTFARVVVTASNNGNLNGGTSPTSFRVYIKDGTYQDYGRDRDSRFIIPFSSSVESWKLGRVYDKNGNFYRIRYGLDEGLPLSIEYTSNEETGYVGQQKINFIYDFDRKDVLNRSVFGRIVLSERRLNRIEILNNFEQVRSYRLDYKIDEVDATDVTNEEDKVARPSRLTAVTQCGLSDQDCFPPVEIKWQDVQSGFVEATDPLDIAPNVLLYYGVADDRTDFDGDGVSDLDITQSIETNRGQWVDVNGDGRLDQVVSVFDIAIVPTEPGAGFALRTYIKTETDWDEQAQWSLPLPLKLYESTTVDIDQFGENPDGSEINVNRVNEVEFGQMLDINGDGLIDILYSTNAPTRLVNGELETFTFNNIFLNTGNGWEESVDYSPNTIPDENGRHANDSQILNNYRDNRSGAASNGTGFVGSKRGVLLDINGDGLVDWLNAFQREDGDGNITEHKITWLNTGSGWERSESYAMPDVFAEYNNGFYLQHGEFVDVNADGLMDWVQAYQRSITNPAEGEAGHEPGQDYIVEAPVINTWLNTGSGWQLDETGDFRLPEPIFDNRRGFDVANQTRRGNFIDINGDGIVDWVRSYVDDGVVELNSSRAAFINHGARFNFTTNAWVETSSHRPPFTQLDHRGNFALNVPTIVRGMYLDINRDGLVDYIQSFSSLGSEVSNITWLNTGNSWKQQDETTPHTINQTIYNYAGGIQANLSRQFTVRRGHFVDINNDGAVDSVINASANTVSGPVVLRSTLLAPPNANDRVVSISNTMGVEMRPVFSPLASANDFYHRDDSTDSLANETAIHITPKASVVQSVEVTRPDDNNLFSVKSYRYRGAQFDRAGRGFLGFREFIETDEDKDIANYFEYNQAFPLTGSLKSVATMVGDHTINAKTIEYDVKELGHSNSNVTFFPYADKTASVVHELVPGSDFISNTVVDKTFDDYGNLLTSNSMVSNANGVIENQERITNTYFAPTIDLSTWVLDLAQSTAIETVMSGKPAINNLTRFSYDSSKRLESIITEPDSSPELSRTTTYGYDDYGNISSEVVTSGSESRVSQTAYDSLSNRFPRSITNAKDQSTIFEYDLVCDGPSKVTDPNSLEVTYSYDEFCREISRTNADGTTQELTYTVGGALDCFDCQTPPVLKVTKSVSGQPDITTYRNGFNQVMASWNTGLDFEQIKHRVEYDQFGRVKRASNEFFQGESELYTEYEYDVLDRPTKTTFPYLNDGVPATETNICYVDTVGRKAIDSIDVQGHVTSTFYNALNKVVEVWEPDNNSLSYDYDDNDNKLRYVYDAKGNVLNTVDADGNRIDVTYDKLARRTSLNDPDLGLTTYRYNGFGEVISETDAKQQETTFKYDELGRLVEKTIPDVDGSQSGGLFTWGYDEGGAIGKLTSESGVNGYSKAYGYDVFGRLVRETSLIRGDVYEQNYSYNVDGLLESKRYPDSGNGQEFSVHYNYKNSYLFSITDRSNDLPGCIEHWRANSYDASGRLLQETLGAIITTNRDYNRAQGVLNSIQSIQNFGSGELLQDVTYEYDAANNVTVRNDHQAVIEEDFEYDDLGRLRFHNRAGKETTEVEYDAIGNITYKSDVGTYSYSGDGGPHAVSSVSDPINSLNDLLRFAVSWEWDGQAFVRSLPSIHNQDFEYDENGNNTLSGSRSFYWTAFNKPYLALEQQANGTQFGSYMEYDADQQRVFKQEGVYSSTGQLNAVRESTVYVGSDYQRITASGEVIHRYTISAGDNAIQIDRTDNSSFDLPMYLLSDNLGSPNVLVNGLGEVVQHFNFDPWGKRIVVDSVIASQSTVNQSTGVGFTGHETDDEIDVINMNARIYDPYLGRFLSADPVLPNAFEMQDYNRYSYVRNNPLKFTDPSGNMPVLVFQVFGSIAFNATPNVSSVTFTVGQERLIRGQDPTVIFTTDFVTGQSTRSEVAGTPDQRVITQIQVVVVTIDYTTGSFAGGSGAETSLSISCLSAVTCSDAQNVEYDQLAFDVNSDRLPSLSRDAARMLYGASDNASGGLLNVLNRKLQSNDLGSSLGFVTRGDVYQGDTHGLVASLSNKIFKVGDVADVFNYSNTLDNSDIENVVLDNVGLELGRVNLESAKDLNAQENEIHLTKRLHFYEGQRGRVEAPKVDVSAEQ